LNKKTLHLTNLVIEASWRKEAKLANTGICITGCFINNLSAVSVNSAFGTNPIGT